MKNLSTYTIERHGDLSFPHKTKQSLYYIYLFILCIAAWPNQPDVRTHYILGPRNTCYRDCSHHKYLIMWWFSQLIWKVIIYLNFKRKVVLNLQISAKWTSRPENFAISWILYIFSKYCRYLLWQQSADSLEKFMEMYSFKSLPNLSPYPLPFQDRSTYTVLSFPWHLDNSSTVTAL